MHLLLELEPDELRMNSRVTPWMGREGEVGRGTRLLGTGEDMRDAAERLVDVVLATASRVRLRKPASMNVMFIIKGGCSVSCS